MIALLSLRSGSWCRTKGWSAGGGEVCHIGSVGVRRLGWTRPDRAQCITRNSGLAKILRMEDHQVGRQGRPANVLQFGRRADAASSADGIIFRKACSKSIVLTFFQDVFPYQSIFALDNFLKNFCSFSCRGKSCVRDAASFAPT